MGVRVGVGGERMEVGGGEGGMRWSGGGSVVGRSGILVGGTHRGAGNTQCQCLN